MNRIYKYLLAIAALAAVGFGIYEYTAPDKYQYWKELIAKDPKPDGVSEQEYRETQGGLLLAGQEVLHARRITQESNGQLCRQVIGRNRSL